MYVTYLSPYRPTYLPTHLGLGCLLAVTFDVYIQCVIDHSYGPDKQVPKEQDSIVYLAKGAFESSQEWRRKSPA